MSREDRRKRQRGKECLALPNKKAGAAKPTGSPKLASMPPGKTSTNLETSEALAQPTVESAVWVDLPNNRISWLHRICDAAKVRAVRFWDWAATWNWYALLVSGGLGAMLRIGEYAITMLLLSIAAFGLGSKLVHSQGMREASRAERGILKGIGLLIVVLGFVYLSVATTASAVKDGSWSNLPRLWAFVANTKGSSKPILSLKAYVAPGYKDGSTVAGLKWKDGFQNIRVNIDNVSRVPIQNLDLTLQVLDKSGDLIAGMGQMSNILGLEFHGPELPDMGVRLRGKDGLSYDFFMRDFVSPGEQFPPWGDYWRLLCPRLPVGITLRLVVPAVHMEDKTAPKHFRILGTYDSPIESGGKRLGFDNILDVTR